MELDDDDDDDDDDDNGMDMSCDNVTAVLSRENLINEALHSHAVVCIEPLSIDR